MGAFREGGTSEEQLLYSACVFLTIQPDNSDLDVKLTFGGR